MAQRRAPLDHAGVAPLATQGVEAAHAGQLEALHGSQSVEAQDDLDRLRAALARRLTASALRGRRARS